MLEIKPIIKHVRIISSHIDISRTLSKSFELKISGKTKTNIPKNIEERKALLNFEINIVTADSEDMKINLLADVFFTFDNIPDDYDKVIEEQCMPLAQAKIFDILDDILVNMGYKKLGLATKK